MNRGAQGWGWGLGLAVALGFARVLTCAGPVAVPPATQAAFDQLQALPAGARVLVAADYDAATAAELEPFLAAMTHDLIARDVGVVVLSLSPEAPPLVAPLLDEIVAAHGAKRGTDLVHLGYVPGLSAAMVATGDALGIVFPRDFRGTPTADLPLLAGVGGLADFDLLVPLAGGRPGVEGWLVHVQGRFVRNVVAATASELAPELAPYLDSGQLQGLVTGIQGAAAFERLVGRVGVATQATVGQSLAHLFLLGVVAFAVWRRREKGRRS